MNLLLFSQADRWYYIDDGPLFETLPHLIDHYCKHMDGLPVLLQQAVPPSLDVRAPLPIPSRPALPTGQVPGKAPPPSGKRKPPPRPIPTRVSSTSLHLFVSLILKYEICLYFE